MGKSNKQSELSKHGKDIELISRQAEIREIKFTLWEK